MKMIRILTYIILLPFIAQAQQKLTIEEAVLKQRTTIAPEKLSQLAWIPNSNTFAWVAKSNGKECLIKEDAKTLKQDTILRIADFAETVYSANPDVAKIERFPFLTWVDENSFRLYFEHAYYSYNLQTKIISPLLKVTKLAEDLDYEPVTNRVAFTLNNQLIVTDKTSIQRPTENKNGEIPYLKSEIISLDAGNSSTNGKAVHRNEFGINKGTFWSSKGNRLAYYRMYESMVTDYPIIDIENKPATTKTIKYPMAGGTSHVVKIEIKDFIKNRSYEVSTTGPADQYLTNIAWTPDEEILLVAIINRDQNEMNLNEYDGTTGGFIKTLFTETSAKYVEPEHAPIFVKNNPGQFLWFSKRDGFNHLYLYDLRGKMIKQLTKGKFDVTEFLGFDQKGTTAFYIAASENGLERMCFAVDMKSGKTSTITRNPGVHSAIANEAGYILDTYSNISTPRKVTLMDKSGAEISILLNSKNPLTNYESCRLAIFNIPSTDKTTLLNCRMYYPPQFDSTKKYPVVVYLYGGPHAQMITNSWLGGGDMWLYYMAQQGFVVFTLDNRGSQNRGIEFENATFKKLGTIEREDQLAGVDFLKNQKYVDVGRMGVFGWSFGGFMSINMMTRTHEFKAGVAGGPVIDWSMYEIMYTERYMDKPQDNVEGYKEANLLNYVKDLKGKLLLIHGTSDDVVLWQHSLEYIKKSVDEGVQVDYFVYPNHKHNVLGKDRVHLMQKVADYFKQNL